MVTLKSVELGDLTPVNSSAVRADLILGGYYAEEFELNGQTMVECWFIGENDAKMSLWIAR